MQPPASWRELPDLAHAASEAAKTGATVDAAAAWGEPAMGCYATWLELRGGSAKPSAVVDELLARAALEGITTSDVAKASSDDTHGVLGLKFERGAYRGTLRAVVDGGAIHALACFWNQREPAACERACATMKEQIK